MKNKGSFNKYARIWSKKFPLGNTEIYDFI